LKWGFSVRIRIEGGEDDFEDEKQFIKYVEAMLEEMLNRNDRNGILLTVFIEEER
jgi:hypothetical protein